MRAMIQLGLLLTALPVIADDVSAGKEDAALFTACPGLSAWAADHPHEDRDLNGSRRAQNPSISTTTGSELARRAELDQRVRAALSGGHPSPTQLRRLAAVDAENLLWLKELVAREGFPTVERFGRAAVLDAWLLVQHADADVGFQQAVLDMLLARSSSGGVKKADIAMLLDRVLLAQGKPQRYGTQFVRDKEGKLVLQEPVEDPPDLDMRRAQVDLMPLSVYRCVLHETYDLPHEGGD